MDWIGLDPAHYTVAIGIFLRLLGVVYLFAYIPFLFQIRGLIGREGILPIADFLARIRQQYGRRRYHYVPTLFWIYASDAALLGFIWAAIGLGCLLIAGFQSPAILALLYLIHLSITTGGQDFLSFGWETYLMEITVASFFMTLTVPYNMFGWLSLNFLLFRFYIQAGMSKIKSGDPSWRNFTAIAYHYLTQPIPNLQAWYFHKLPMWFHKMSVALMFFAELIAPFFMWSFSWVRLFSFTQICGLQCVIWFTGNLSYLNHMVAFQSILLIHNRFFASSLAPSVAEVPTPLVWNIIASFWAALFFALQVLNLLQTFFPTRTIQRIMYTLQFYHVCYPHGIFAVMTTKRYEIVVEGSRDGVEWKEYAFYHKPGDLKRRPRRISPYQPRIDWQAWFLPFRPYPTPYWFQSFLVKLLQNSKPVVRLLRFNPFADTDGPPKYVRARMYDYEFTTFQEKKETGCWWKRTDCGLFVFPILLKRGQDGKI